jgi:hypothetical protein
MLTNISAFWRTISGRLLLDTFQEMTTYSRMTTRPYIELVRPRSNVARICLRNMSWHEQIHPHTMTLNLRSVLPFTKSGLHPSPRFRHTYTLLSCPMQTCDSSLNITLLHWYWVVQCHGVGMYLLQRRRNTYQRGREYKCWQIHQHSGGQYLAGYC